MIAEFAWDRNSLSQVDSVSCVPCLIGKGMVRESVSKIKNGKFAGPSRGFVSEMVKAAGEARVHMIADLVNHIIVEGVIPAEWELSIILNCYKGKGDSLERGNHRGLELAYQILKIVERIIKMLVRQQIDIDEMQFTFTPEFETKNGIFIERQLQEKYMAKKENLYFAFVDLEKAFVR